MITVTLGTIPFQFNRAVEWLSALLKDGTISEPVFLQYGVSDISAIEDHPLITAMPLVEVGKLNEKIDSSRLVISHAGQGTTRGLAARNSSFILLPRLSRYGEHVDDHQLMFAQSVQPLGVRYCQSLIDLRQWVLNPPPRFEQSLLNEPKLVDHLIKTFPAKTYLYSRK